MPPPSLLTTTAARGGVRYISVPSRARVITGHSPPSFHSNALIITADGRRLLPAEAHDGGGLDKISSRDVYS
ncbi:hypothetical protein C0Q70_18599 [Pomacea canaliculata]|uniref:Uncharacterized protein n=1 Tax=Pomacea canaliculata TaxID=400727 RepID=A0A2T7NGY6_POMCA|nr:hypothetical protein C0Q70_18599 [Pomacea canaliculata]